jgi:hypothetical protein
MMPNLPPAGPSSFSLSTITAALGYNTFQPRTHQSSTFVPYFGFLSLMLSAIDRVMLNTYRFNQSNPDWHPLFTQIYYSIIFIVHTIRVRRTAGNISQHESDFLTWFESNFPLSSLPIAGPVKHFFQAITVCTGPSKFHGNIFPSLPSLTCNASKGYLLTPQWVNSVLPPIPFLMDRLNDIARPGTSNWNVNDWNRYHAAGINQLYGNDVTGPTFFGFPGITDLLNLPASSMSVFRSCLVNMSLPTRLQMTGRNLTSVAEFCRLGSYGTQHSLWFPTVVGMMQRHAQFLKDSTNVASLSTVGLGATIPIIKFSANDHLALENAADDKQIYPVAKQPAQEGPPPTVEQPKGYNAQRFHHLRVTATSKRFDLHLIAEQFSLLSCVNVSFTNAGTRENEYLPLPTNAQLRTGPMWDYPDVKEHVEVDVLGQFNLFLVGAFHTDQRMTR